eukprot:208384-Chlamydomonas_euryale.AAC.1
MLPLSVKRVIAAMPVIQADGTVEINALSPKSIDTSDESADQDIGSASVSEFVDASTNVRPASTLQAGGSVDENLRGTDEQGSTG